MMITPRPKYKNDYIIVIPITKEINSTMMLLPVPNASMVESPDVMLSQQESKQSDLSSGPQYF